MYGTCCLFPWSFPLQNSYLFVHFFTFHRLFQLFSSRQLKRYLKLLLVYFYFSFAIWATSCQTRQPHCCFCNGRWLRSTWLVLGLQWGSQFPISCHHPGLGTWLRMPWGVGCTVLAKADWQASEQTMTSQNPFTWNKNLPKASKDKGGLWSSQTLASGGRWLFGCFGSACPRSEEGCFGTASDSAPACEVFSNFDLKWGCFGLSGSCFSQALAASGKLLPAVKAALACFGAVPTSPFEAALTVTYLVSFCT